MYYRHNLGKQTLLMKMFLVLWNSELINVCKKCFKTSWKCFKSLYAQLQVILSTSQNYIMQLKFNMMQFFLVFHKFWDYSEWTMTCLQKFFKWHTLLKVSDSTIQFHYVRSISLYMESLPVHIMLMYLNY